MAIPLRTCLLDPTNDATGTLRPAFERLESVSVLDVCSSWQSLQEHLRFGNVDMVAVNLDCVDEPRFISVRRIAELAPDCGILGVSADVRPDTLIGALRAGCHQFVRSPIEPEDLREAVDRLRQTRAPAASGQLIAVIGSSGGAGATTLACNLALELAHITGRHAGLVDLNLQFGDVACSFDVTPRYSVADLCRPGMAIDRTLLDMAVEMLPCNVALLARPENLADADEVVPEAVEQLLRQLTQVFPYSVVDLPRMLAGPTLAALRCADRILITSQLAVPFLRNAQRIHKSMLDLGIPEGRIGLVLNRAKTDHERITPEEVEKHFGRPVFASIPNDYKHITASRDLGHPILATAPHSPARHAIETLARKLADALPAAAAQPAKARGLLGLFGRKAAATASASE